MSYQPAARMSEIAPFQVMELLARAKALEAQGRSIIHMEVGEPDFPTPAPIIEAAQRFIAGGNVHYTPALGLPALREAIAAYYRERSGIVVDPARVVVTAGASAALLLALGVLLDPGSKLMLADPGYPCNRNFARLFEARAQPLPVGADSAYQPTPEQVAANWSATTRALLVASPSNPTGTLISPPHMRELAAVVESRGGTLLVDEIYHGLTYGVEARSALEISDEIFVVNSFSKYFGMTGWRLGWLVAPSRYVRDIEKLAQNMYIAPSTPAQHAALAAFVPATIAILEQRRAQFEQRRNLLLPGLSELGFAISAAPQGAFYIYAGLGDLATDSHRLALDLLEHAGVAATPGLDFGCNHARAHIRFAYTTGLDKLATGLARMRQFMERKP